MKEWGGDQLKSAVRSKLHGVVRDPQLELPVGLVPMDERRYEDSAHVDLLLGQDPRRRDLWILRSRRDHVLHPVLERLAQGSGELVTGDGSVVDRDAFFRGRIARPLFRLYK